MCRAPAAGVEAEGGVLAGVEAEEGDPLTAVVAVVVEVGDLPEGEDAAVDGSGAGTDDFLKSLRNTRSSHCVMKQERGVKHAAATHFFCNLHGAMDTCGAATCCERMKFGLQLISDAVEFYLLEIQRCKTHNRKLCKRSTMFLTLINSSHCIRTAT